MSMTRGIAGLALSMYRSWKAGTFHIRDDPRERADSLQNATFRASIPLPVDSRIPSQEEEEAVARARVTSGTHYRAAIDQYCPGINEEARMRSSRARGGGRKRGSGRARRNHYGNETLSR